MNKAYNTYRLFVPYQAFGTSVVFFDLFNPTTSQFQLDVYSVVPIVSGANAVTGVIGVDIFLTRTSDVGTGGTAATYNGTSLTACTLSKMIGAGDDLSGSITARLTPTGGATAAAVISQCSVFTEETNAGTYLTGNDFVRRLYDDMVPLEVPQGTGIRVVQNAVASVGNIAFDVIFQARPKA